MPRRIYVFILLCQETQIVYIARVYVIRINLYVMCTVQIRQSACQTQENKCVFEKIQSAGAGGGQMELRMATAEPSPTMSTTMTWKYERVNYK